MKLTKKAAKKKWCPLLRIANSDSEECGFNAAIEDDEFIQLEYTCIADDCMMWRQVEDDENCGYCGLAGKPN